MELDQQKLKEKALLLLQRERELFELRIKHERATAWLNLAQALPQIFTDPNFSLSGAFTRLRKALLEGLKVQRVSFLAMEAEGLRPIAPPGPVRPLSAEMRALLLAEAVGVVNDQSGPGGVADLFGLTRFIWTRIDLAGGTRVVLVAGYDASKAKFFSGFDDSDAANLRNTGQHIHGLIGNALLAKELQAANETLEQRVVERTTQLERRNRDMRLVLDNVVTALATVDVTGRLAEERSATLDQWFGAFTGIRASSTTSRRRTPASPRRSRSPTTPWSRGSCRASCAWTSCRRASRARGGRSSARTDRSRAVPATAGSSSSSRT